MNADVQPKRSRSRVSRESDLEWFWSDGQSIFESSSFGSVLERQSHYGQHAVPCVKCGGSGFTTNDGTCRACGGLGGKPARLSALTRSRRGQLVLSTSRCPRCSGRTGIRSCVLCKGEGALTLAPVGLRSSPYDEPPSYAPNENDLTRYAQVSRWLLKIPAEAVRVLESYYGIEGFRWGATKWGRLTAVLPHTPAGRSMLRKTTNPLGLPPRVLLANVVEQIDRIVDIQKRIAARARFALATREAREVYGCSCTAWNAAVEASRR